VEIFIQLYNTLTSIKSLKIFIENFKNLFDLKNKKLYCAQGKKITNYFLRIMIKSSFKSMIWFLIN